MNYVWFLLTLMVAASRSAYADAPWDAALVDAKTKAICASHDALRPPDADLPAAPQENCDSEKLYYGIGMPVDDAAARRCAFQEDEAGDAPELGGPAILMMIYANGRGVPKNLDLAIKYACDMGGAPAEITGRVAHLVELQTLPAGAKLKECADNKTLPAAYCAGQVDLCDDITSGYMMGYCQAKASDIKEAENGTAFDKATQAYSAVDKRALSALTKAADAYFESHADNEIDLSGTARAAQMIEEKDKMVKQFRAAILAFDAGKRPIASAADFARADRTLNQTYAQTLKDAARKDNMFTIRAGGIRDTQRAWLVYRDAWVLFAATHYPGWPADAVKTWLTKGRTAILKTMLDGAF